MKNYHINQCFISRSERELGLGFIDQIEPPLLTLTFPAQNTNRQYDIHDAPINRIRFSKGTVVRDKDLNEFAVEDILEEEGCYVYCGNGKHLHECELDPLLDFSGPVESLKSLRFYPTKKFDLRFQAHQLRRTVMESPLQGFFAGSIELFPHQLYIADTVTKRQKIRVLLSDEVGLGKTIEAALIIHKLLMMQRIKKVLIVVPESLMVQWFIELYLRFNLSFTMLNDEWIEHNCELHEAISELNLIICPLNKVSDLEIDTFDYDLVCFDEVHHLKLNEEGQVISDLCEKSEHLILISATPTMKGDEQYFNRLKLLDASLFSDFERFKLEQEKNETLVQVCRKIENGNLDKDDLNFLKEMFPWFDSEEELKDPQNAVKALTEAYGIGHLVFRNSRTCISGFPQRLKNLVSLDPGKKAMPEQELQFTWIVEQIKNGLEDKVLILCKDLEQAKELSSYIKRRVKTSFAQFHEELPMLERDRQAAWFLDEDGPKLLISSPIGAEGRNFQCANEMILLDLPFEAESLEQRIGRLDRIGQGDSFLITVPVKKGDVTEILFRWYDAVLNIFDHAWKGSEEFLQVMQEELKTHCENFNEEAFSVFVKTCKSKVADYLKQCERGKDILLEKNSLNEDVALTLKSELLQMEKNSELKDFMLMAFDRYGIEADENDVTSYNLEAGDGYDGGFPGFKEDGMQITFSREQAVKRDDMHFMSWDHPMVRNSLDYLTCTELGNSNVSLLKASQNNILLDMVFLVTHHITENIHGDAFFAPQVFRLVMDQHGKDMTPMLEGLNQHAKSAKSDFLEKHTEYLDKVDAILEMGKKQIMKDVNIYIDKKINEIKNTFKEQELRLEHLSDRNPSVSVTEIEKLKEQKTLILKGVESAQCRLDAVKLIVCYKPS